MVSAAKLLQQALREECWARQARCLRHGIDSAAWSQPADHGSRRKPGKAWHRRFRGTRPR